MKILFVNLSPPRFTVVTPDSEPLGGTESCIARLAQKMALNRHSVTLLCRLPDGTAEVIDGVRHAHPDILKQHDFLAAQKFDVIVACNAPNLCPILRTLAPDAKIILWNHVPPEQQAVRDLADADVLRAIDLIVYVSDWQRQATEAHFKITHRATVIGNGLTPGFETMFASPEDLLRAKQCRAAYTTIPYRGLAVLLKALPQLRHDVAIDLFSSMRVYQASDEPYAELLRQAEQHPRIQSHGSVAQPKLAAHLRASAFLAYPSIIAETFCIGVIEAIAAGMKVVTTRLGALPDTTQGFADLVDIRANDAETLARDYAAALDRAITAFMSKPQEWAEERFAQMQAINRSCTWSARAEEWQKALHTLGVPGEASAG